MAPCTSAQHYTEGCQATDSLMASRGLSIVIQFIATILENVTLFQNIHVPLHAIRFLSPIVVQNGITDPAAPSDLVTLSLRWNLHISF